MPDNPEVVQPAEFGTPGATPIFLIHDGGGTTFAYHCLGSLSRPVYGIWNPKFYSGRPWEGGIPEMARVYVDMIRKAVADPSFPGGGRRASSRSVGTIFPARAGSGSSRRMDGRVGIFLGGWSLGGLLSIEVAHLLDGDDAIAVQGIVMADSVYPVRPPDFSVELTLLSDEPADGSSKTQASAHRCMKHARKMLETYTLPSWPESTSTTRTTRGPPPTVLLKATGRVPSRDETISPVDVYREDEMLGWGGYHSGTFIVRVLEMEAHHFDMFSMEKVDMATKRIKNACDFLDR
jgi:thioesterase domain-containing protein